MSGKRYWKDMSAARHDYELLQDELRECKAKVEQLSGFSEDKNAGQHSAILAVRQWLKVVRFGLDELVNELGEEVGDE